MNLRTLFTSLVALLLLTPLSGGEKLVFDDLHSLRSPWKYFGKIPFIPKVKFTSLPGTKYPESCGLAIESDKGTGLLICYPGIDIKKTPIIRWRWRLVKGLNVSDGEIEPDEQAVVIYVGDGNRFTQRTVAYRWEVLTDIGKRIERNYSAGAIKMGGICMRNRTTAVGKWVTEERNILEDFKSFFSDDMKNCGIAIGANSQYSMQSTAAEIDYIEFLTVEEAAANPIPESEK